MNTLVEASVRKTVFFLHSKINEQRKLVVKMTHKATQLTSAGRAVAHANSKTVPPLCFVEVASEADMYQSFFGDGAMSGVTIGVTDCLDVKGFKTRYGVDSSMLHELPTHEFPFVSWLRRHGAQFVGKLAMESPISFHDAAVIKGSNPYAFAVSERACHYTISTSMMGPAGITSPLHYDVAAFKPTAQSFSTYAHGYRLSIPSMSVGITAGRVDDLLYLWQVYTGAIQPSTFMSDSAVSWQNEGSTGSTNANASSGLNSNDGSMGAGGTLGGGGVDEDHHHFSFFGSDGTSGGSSNNSNNNNSSNNSGGGYEGDASARSEWHMWRPSSSSANTNSNSGGSNAAQQQQQSKGVAAYTYHPMRNTSSTNQTSGEANKESNTATTTSAPTATTATADGEGAKLPSSASSSPSAPKTKSSSFGNVSASSFSTRSSKQAAATAAAVAAAKEKEKISAAAANATSFTSTPPTTTTDSMNDSATPTASTAKYILSKANSSFISEAAAGIATPTTSPPTTAAVATPSSSSSSGIPVVPATSSAFQPPKPISGFGARLMAVTPMASRKPQTAGNAAATPNTPSEKHIEGESNTKVSPTPTSASASSPPSPSANPTNGNNSNSSNSTVESKRFRTTFANGSAALAGGNSSRNSNAPLIRSASSNSGKSGTNGFFSGMMSGPSYEWPWKRNRSSPSSTNGKRSSLSSSSYYSQNGSGGRDVEEYVTDSLASTTSSFSFFPSFFNASADGNKKKGKKSKSMRRIRRNGVNASMGYNNNNYSNSNSINGNSNNNNSSGGIDMGGANGSSASSSSSSSVSAAASTLPEGALLGVPPAKGLHRFFPWLRWGRQKLAEYPLAEMNPSLLRYRAAAKSEAAAGGGPQIELSVGYPAEWIDEYCKESLGSANAFLERIKELKSTRNAMGSNLQMEVVPLRFDIDLEAVVSAVRVIAMYELSRAFDNLAARHSFSHLPATAALKLVMQSQQQKMVVGEDSSSTRRRTEGKGISTPLPSSGGGSSSSAGSSSSSMRGSGILEELPGEIVSAIFNGRSLTDMDYHRALRTRDSVVRATEEQFRDVDIIVSPVLSEPYLDGNIRSILPTLPFTLGGNPMVSLQLEKDFTVVLAGELGRDTGLLEDAITFLQFVKGTSPGWWRRKFLSQ